MSRSPIDQRVHDLLDEANLLLLEMTLPGSEARIRAASLATRLRACAEEAKQAGKGKSAQHLREAAGMLEREAGVT